MDHVILRKADGVEGEGVATRRALLPGDDADLGLRDVHGYAAGAQHLPIRGVEWGHVSQCQRRVRTRGIHGHVRAHCLP